MSVGAIVLLLIAAYAIGGLITTPRLMRYAYLDKRVPMREELARYEKQLDDYKRSPKDRIPPFEPHQRRESYVRQEARMQGAWWATIWPIGIAYFALGEHAFRGEIAAQEAERNAQIIRDYDRILEERFDRELAAAPRPEQNLVGIIRRLTSGARA